MPARLLLLALTSALSLAACQGDAPDGDPGTAADDGPSAGTYRAYFVTTGPNGPDTTDVVEGALRPPVPSDAMVAVDLPAHSGTVRFTNRVWPLLDGLGDSAFLLSYRDPVGTRALYSTEFDTDRMERVHPDSADVRVLALSPMWNSEAPSHTLSVFDGADSLTSFSLERPTTDIHATRIDAAGAAGMPSVEFVVETRWTDGRERPVFLAFRNDDGWHGLTVETNATAVAEPGEQIYKESFTLSAQHPEVFLVAVEE